MMMMTPDRIKPAVPKLFAGCAAMLILLVLSAFPAQAFMPNCNQLLYMMEKAMGHGSMGLLVQQTKVIPDLKDSDTYQDIDQYSFMEKLTMFPPGNVRTDILSGPNSGYSIESDLKYIKVANDIIISESKSLEDHYTDILLCQSQKNLKTMLTLTGMNTAMVGYDRCSGKICYVIGNPDRQLMSSALWIDHETFLPIRYRLCLNNQIIDFSYENWEKTSRIWYPMHITMHMDERIITIIEADHVSPIKKTDQPNSSLFDIKGIMQTLPKNINTSSPDASILQPKRTDPIKELDKDIENFGKMYE